MEHLWELIVLFFVIFDPLMSFAMFFAASKTMNKKQRVNTALLAILVAGGLSYIVLFSGEGLLKLFSTPLTDFKVAGGIILGILGIKMVLGQNIIEPEEHKRTSYAIAAVIGTPLITGPAAITAIIIAVHDFGLLVTGIAIAVILAFILLLFLLSSFIRKFVSDTVIQILSTILGLITVAWGVTFVRAGLGI
jgi:multiple antibiotic resistance protein